MRDIFQKIVSDIEPIETFNVPVLLENMEVAVYEGGTYGDTNIIATIYRNYTGGTQGPAVESGATGGPNPFYTGPDGLIEFWAEAGFYDVVINDVEDPARVSERVIRWNAVPGQSASIPGRLLDINDFHIADIFANRPAPSTELEGVRFFATDTKNEYQCISSVWVQLNVNPPPYVDLEGPSSTQGVISDSSVALKFDSSSEHHDTANMWSVANPTRIVAPKTGRYLFEVMHGYTGVGVADPIWTYVDFVLNGGVWIDAGHYRNDDWGAFQDVSTSLSSIITLNANDYIEARVARGAASGAANSKSLSDSALRAIYLGAES